MQMQHNMATVNEIAILQVIPASLASPICTNQAKPQSSCQALHYNTLGWKVDFEFTSAVLMMELNEVSNACFINTETVSIAGIRLPWEATMS